jgi:Tfp pilus assembly PilM family ATPase
MAHAAPRALVEAATQALEGAGFEPLVLDTGVYAASYALAGEGRQLIGDLGAVHSTWTLVTDETVQRIVVSSAGAAGLTAEVAAALAVDAETAETYLAQQAVESWPAMEPGAAAAVEAYVEAQLRAIARFAPETPAPAADEAAGEAADDWPPPPAWPFEVVRLCGAGALMPGLAERLTAAAGLPVVLADGFARLGLQAAGWLPDEVARQAPAYVASLGLAVRPWVVES